MIGGRRPLVPEILDQSDRVGAKSPFFDLFSLVAPQLNEPRYRVRDTVATGLLNF